MSQHRQHYQPWPVGVTYWTPLRIAFAVTYAAAFITLYFVL